MTHNRMIGFHPGTEFPASDTPVLAKTTAGWRVIERENDKWWSSDEEISSYVVDSDVLFWAYVPELP